MTKLEKLRLMEALWADLCRHEADVDSPDWHADVLARRPKRIDQGQAEFSDWKEAKKRIRDVTS